MSESVGLNISSCVNTEGPFMENSQRASLCFHDISIIWLEQSQKKKKQGEGEEERPFTQRRRWKYLTGYPREFKNFSRSVVKGRHKQIQRMAWDLVVHDQIMNQLRWLHVLFVSCLPSSWHRQSTVVCHVFESKNSRPDSLKMAQRHATSQLP